MRDFNDIKHLISSNKSNYDNNYYNCIPFELFPRFEKVVPGITQGTQYLLTGSSGCAKSKISRYLFIHTPYQYVKNHPELEIDLDIHYFSLEESKEKIYLSELSRTLRTKFGLSISVNDLRSIGKNNTISKEVFPKIDECKEEVERFINKVKIYDKYSSNPTGVHKILKDVAHKSGKFYRKDGTLFSEHERLQLYNGVGDAFKILGSYKLNNPRHYVIVLFDNVNIMPTESGLNLHEAISKLSSDYFLGYKNRNNFIHVIVQQQAMSKEQLEFTSRGVSIEEKLEPSIDALGDNKLIARDQEIILGIFNPARYGIKEHDGYDIQKLADNYRSLKVLKNRDGLEGRKLPLFFDGACDFFKEMPCRKTEPDRVQKAYECAKQLAMQRK